jgi:hypothetical protein
LLEESASAVLVIEVGDTVLNYFSTRKSGGVTETDLFEFAEEMQKAFLLGNGDSRPSNKQCARTAHAIASNFRADGDAATNPLHQKKFYNEARKYEDVCDRFLKGLSISHLSDDDGRTISYYVKGDSGYAYSLNAGANSCTCHAGRSSTEICWHMRAVECFLTAKSRYE